MEKEPVEGAPEPDIYFLAFIQVIGHELDGASFGADFELVFRLAEFHEILPEIFSQVPGIFLQIIQDSPRVIVPDFLSGKGPSLPDKIINPVKGPIDFRSLVHNILSVRNDKKAITIKLVENYVGDIKLDKLRGILPGKTVLSGPGLPQEF